MTEQTTNTRIVDFHTITEAEGDDLILGTDRSLDEMDSVIRITGRDEHGSDTFRAHYAELTWHEATVLAALVSDQIERERGGAMPLVLDSGEVSDEDLEVILDRLQRLASYAKP